MPFNNNAKHVMLDQLATLALYASLHSTDPGVTGTGELAGGAPAYVRKAVTWGASANGAKPASNAPVFNVPAGAAVKYAGLWSAETGGVFYGGEDVPDETYNAQGTYTLQANVLQLLDPA